MDLHHSSCAVEPWNCESLESQNHADFSCIVRVKIDQSINPGDGGFLPGKDLRQLVDAREAQVSHILNDGINRFNG